MKSYKLSKDINFFNTTFIIVTYKSENIIDKCLRDLPKKSPKIIIENSKNFNLKKNLEKRYKNLKCIITKKNFGYGKSNNIGIKLAKTKYIFILNPDTKLKKVDFNKIVKILKNQEFAVAAPIIKEKFKLYKQNKTKKKIMEVNHIPGMAMILNKTKIKKILFDENFFLYLEEIDLCKRIKKIKERILEINVQISHLGGLSHGAKNFEIDKTKNWHWMLSKFYYSSKYNGYVYSLLVFIPYLILLFIKIIFYSAINKNKKQIYYMRFSGLLNSILKNNSFQRPFEK